MKKITVLLAEPNGFIREGLRALLEAEVDMKVVGEAKNSREVVKMAVALRPDVVLIGIAMSLISRLDATKQILRALPTSKLLFLSTDAAAAYVEQATGAGAAGFLLIHNSSGDLTKAIREIQNGRTFFSGSIAQRPHNSAVPVRTSRLEERK